MTAKQTIEKRSSRRAKCQAISQFKNLDSETPVTFYDTFISDISESGIRFRSPKFIPIHHRLSFKINLPKHLNIEAVAKPAWILELPNLGQYDIGAHFVILSDTDKAVLKNFFTLADKKGPQEKP